MLDVPDEARRPRVAENAGQVLVERRTIFGLGPSMSMLSVAVHAPAPRSSTAAATTVLSNIDAYDGFILCCNNNGQPFLYPVPRTIVIYRQLYDSANTDKRTA